MPFAGNAAAGCSLSARGSTLPRDREVSISDSSDSIDGARHSRRVSCAGILEQRGQSQPGHTTSSMSNAEFSALSLHAKDWEHFPNANTY